MRAVGDPSRQWLLSLTVLAGLIGLGGAWAISSAPDNVAASAARVVALLAGSTVLGFGLLSLLDHRHVDDRTIWRRVAATSAGWTVAELLLLALSASAAGGETLAGLSTPAFASFAFDSTSGQVGLLTAACTLGITALGAALARTSTQVSTTPVVVLACFALVTRPITGHMSQQSFGSILGAMHVVAAAVWLGLLIAMGALLRSKRAWADLLPRYSRIAFWCVVIVTITGVVNAAVRLGSVTALVGTGYGHIVVAKVVVVLLLVAGGWWLRRVWVQPIGDHRIDVSTSLRRAVIETAVMAVAFGLAAALATAA